MSSSVADEYRELMDQWAVDTCWMSGGMENHAAYAQLVVMGKEILPFVLEDLRTKRENSWLCFLLLYALVDDKPYIPEEDYGKLDKISAVWVQWGKDNGYIPYSKYEVLEEGSMHRYEVIAEPPLEDEVKKKQ